MSIVTESTELQRNAAQHAYSQYRSAMGNKDHVGRTLADWDSLVESQKEVWISLVGDIAHFITSLPGELVDNIKELSESPAVIRFLD